MKSFTNPLTVLIVDDEPQIRRLIKSSFSGTPHKVVEAEDGASAMRLAAEELPDVVLLDLGLPDMDGVDVTRGIREWSSMPIIVLTARAHEDDKVEALDAGADDYMTKPFGIKELVARMRVVLRRNIGSEGAAPTVEFGECRLDMALRQISVAGELVHLTPIEYKLLAFLAKHADKVVTHKMLLAEAWGPGYDFDTQYLRVHFKNLRHKLESEPSNPQCIQTEPGVGYRLVTRKS